MQISAIRNDNSPNFGHSLRVSICLKGENGAENIFINPKTEKTLYKKLNSRIINWLNEDHLTNLRSIFGIQRKTSKTETIGNIPRHMIEELRAIDNDYALFSYVRSAYRRNQLGYIITGIDVPIAENIKGLKHIGIAKADSKIYYGNTHTEYIKSLVKAVKGNIIDYIQNDNVLLRSKNNKEIMLKTVFKQTGTNKSGNPIYELDSYEFHENRTKRTLAPMSQAFKDYKYSSDMYNEIQNTIQNQLNKILGRKTYFKDLNRVLNLKTQKVEAKTQNIQQHVQQNIPQKSSHKVNKQPIKKVAQEKPIQLEFDFKD